VALPDPLLVEPLDDPPDAIVRVPGSKSITNRALVCAALAGGQSELVGALRADDTDAMVESLVRLGARIDVADAEGEDGVVRVEGTGGHLRPGPIDLDTRLSGTTARFLAPMVALGSGRYRLDGAPPLRRRPMADGIAALRDLGVAVDEEGQPGHLPIVVTGGVRGGTLRLGGDVSSQFLSGFMLSGPAMPGGLRAELTTPLVSRPYVALTEHVMGGFGVDVTRTDDTLFVVAPGAYLGRRYRVEPDASAASYFFAAAAITGGRVRIDGLGVDSRQGDVAFVDVLESMGALVERDARGITVSGGAALDGVDVNMSDCSDTAPTLAAVAVFARSATRITGIGFIRRKETDRIAALVHELRRCGIEARDERDGLVVEPGWPRPAVISTYHDHRMAMAFGVLGLRTPGISIADPGCVDKTFPGFWDALEQLR
jgi:3-phosphoshikimate 1-carboxyvinyltransferase